MRPRQQSKQWKLGHEELETFSEVLVPNWEQLQTLLVLPGLTGGKSASGYVHPKI